MKSLEATRQRLDQASDITALEKEWAIHKYLVLEHSPSLYQKIRTLLKDKFAYPKEEFLTYLEEALTQKPTTNQSLNALDHVWGHFKKGASPEERETYANLRADFQETGDSREIKTYLHQLSLNYQDLYLLASSFFDES